MIVRRERMKWLSACIMIIGMFVVLVLVTDTADAATITVDDNGGADYEKIQWAVDNATVGDTIRVYAGLYNEVVINKTVEMIGNGSTETIIAGGINIVPITISADYVNVSSVRTSSSANTGILVTSDHNIISNCNASNGYNGISLSLSSYNIIRDSNFTSTLIASVSIGASCNYNEVLNCNILNSDYGVYLKNSARFNTIDGNWIYGNSDGGIYENDKSYNIYSNNTISNNGPYGIYLFDTFADSIENNIITRNNDGIYLASGVNNIDITGNTITDNTRAGIYVATTGSGIRVHNNSIHDNGQYGIFNLYTTTTDARKNWWGHSSGPYDNKGLPGAPDYNNPAGLGGEVTSYVNYMPWYGSSTTTPSSENVFVTYNPTRVVTDTIQGGIDAAHPGDTIYVNPGTYYENVIVNKTVTLIANDTANTIINGSGSGDVVQITADWVNMSGFTVTNSGSASGDAGIEVTSDNTYIHNITSSSNLRGFIITSSSGSVFEHNHAWGNARGFQLESSTSTTLSSNIVNSSSSDGFFLTGSQGNVITNNTITTAQIYGILLHASSGNSITHNTISNNGYGIEIRFSSSCTIEYNSITTNVNDGIIIQHSSPSNTVQYNSIYGNGDYGIEADSSSPVDASGNSWGHSSGPYHTILNPLATGDRVSDYVDYTPWLHFGTDTELTTPGFQPDLSYLHVDKNSPQTGSMDYIEEGIDMVSGSTVYVEAGTYVENVVVDKTINLIGAGTGNTTIDGGGNGDVVRITVDWVNMSGFTVTNSGSSGTDSGIDVTADHTHISNTIVSSNLYGIHLSSSSGNTLDDNTCLNNDYGIYLYSGSSNTITNNTCNANNDFGIWFASSSSNTITNNTCDSNDFFGIYLESSSSNTLSNNTCSDNADVGISLHLSSTNNILANNTCSINLHGIRLTSSNSNTITNNTCDSNYRSSMRLTSSSSNTISNNTCYSNDYGIYLDSSSSNTITNNTFDSNNYGIYLQSSSINNEIHYNSIAGNTNSGIDADSSSSVDASGNWWGSSSGPSGEGSGTGDAASTNVDFTPWLHYGTDTSTDTGFQPDLSYLHVDDNSPQTGSAGRIQEAIDMVSGSTVEVEAGTYTGDVTIDKTLSLIGAGRDVTFINGSGSTGIHIMADWVNVSGFTVRDSYNGIYLFQVNNCTINGNNVENYYYGIRLFESETNPIYDNILEHPNSGGLGNPTSFHLSQLTTTGWEEIYIESFPTDYETKAFPVSIINGRVVMRFVQRDTPFGDIEQIRLVAGEEIIAPDYAIYAETGEDVLDDILWDDHNVVVAHDRVIEVGWTCKSGEDDATLYLKANEYGHGYPLEFPMMGTASYEMGSNPGTITVDGVLENVGEPLYQPYWRPTSGHPDGYTYIYVNDDSNYLYISLDITSDNTNESGEDWTEITIGGKTFRVDDFDDTFGVSGFGLTDTVSYKHQTVEMRIPKSSIGQDDITFSLRYYGTDAVVNVIGIFVAESDGNVIEWNSVSNNTHSGIRLNGSDHNMIGNNTCWNNTNGIDIYTSDHNTLEMNNLHNNSDNGAYVFDSDNCEVVRNTAANNGGAGVRMSDSADGNVSNNQIRDCEFGVRVSSSSGFLLDNNTCVLSTKDGIIIGSGSSWFNVTYNDCSNNTSDGIYVNANNGTFSNNICNFNGQHGIVTALSRDLVISDNTINSNTARNLMLYDTHYSQIQGNTASWSQQEGIALNDCDHNTITGNTVQGNDGYGIYIWAGSWWNTITFNTATGNTQSGINFYDDSQWNTAENNTTPSNTFGGIRFVNADNNTASYNTCDSNLWNIPIHGSSNITLYHNTVTNASSDGIYVSGSSRSVIIHNNTIAGNTNFGVVNYASDVVDARYNWWGDTSGPFDNKVLPNIPNYNNTGGQGNAGSSHVDYYPWYSVLNINTGEYYYTIQDAIDDADPGNILKVGDREYRENIIIDKPIQIVGDPTLDAMGGIGFWVQANDTLIENFTVTNCTKGFLVHNGSNIIENVTLRNHTIRNCYRFGIEFDSVIDSVVDGVVMEDIANTTDTAAALYLHDSSSNDFVDISFSNVAGWFPTYGIYLRNCDWINISTIGELGNITSDNIAAYGLFLENSDHNDIDPVFGNITAGNGDAFGLYLEDSSHNTITDLCFGTVHGSASAYGIYLTASAWNNITTMGQLGDILSDDGSARGIFLGQSDHNTIDPVFSDVTASNGAAFGIFLYRSDANEIIGFGTGHITATTMAYGIDLYDAHSNNVTASSEIGNITSQFNMAVGIMIEESNLNTVTAQGFGNLDAYTAHEYAEGIFLEEAENNTIVSGAFGTISGNIRASVIHLDLSHNNTIDQHGSADVQAKLISYGIFNENSNDNIINVNADIGNITSDDLNANGIIIENSHDINFNAWGFGDITANDTKEAIGIGLLSSMEIHIVTRGFGDIRGGVNVYGIDLSGSTDNSISTWSFGDLIGKSTARGINIGHDSDRNVIDPLFGNITSPEGAAYGIKIYLSHENIITKCGFGDIHGLIHTIGIDFYQSFDNNITVRLNIGNITSDNNEAIGIQLVESSNNTVTAGDFGNISAGPGSDATGIYLTGSFDNTYLFS
jgi:parallel beta-helix repeat protein